MVDTGKLGELLAVTLPKVGPTVLHSWEPLRLRPALPKSSTLQGCQAAGAGGAGAGLILSWPPY